MHQICDILRLFLIWNLIHNGGLAVGENPSHITLVHCGLWTIDSQCLLHIMPTYRYQGRCWGSVLKWSYEDKSRQKKTCTKITLDHFKHTERWFHMLYTMLLCLHSEISHSRCYLRSCSDRIRWYHKPFCTEV